jgi:hypothetical protein
LAKRRRPLPTIGSSFFGHKSLFSANPHKSIE